jgi:hypothetical protein
LKEQDVFEHGLQELLLVGGELELEQAADVVMEALGRGLQLAAPAIDEGAAGAGGVGGLSAGAEQFDLEAFAFALFDLQGGLELCHVEVVLPPLLLELVFQLSEALLIGLLGREVVLELLTELLHLRGQGGGALLAAAAFAAFGLQFGGGSCQGRDGGAQAAFDLEELVLQVRLPFARSRSRGGRRLGLGLGALELLGALGQALLQFVEAGFGFGSGL